MEDFFLEPGIFELITGDNCIWEDSVLKNLSLKSQLMSF